jgi:hypothetical protein
MKPISDFYLWIFCTFGAVFALPAFAAADNPVHQSAVRLRLQSELPILGHRNWIVIADMAYPAQVSSGIETIYVGGNHLDAIREVLDMVDKAPHVRPLIHIDQELNAVSEVDAPGISAFRKGLREVLKTRHVVELKHDDTIAKLNEAGKTFKILVLKTSSTLPYTSVFVRLECGYWTDAAEKRLRKSLE